MELLIVCYKLLYYLQFDGIYDVILGENSFVL
jgi:hypothetical protein